MENELQRIFLLIADISGYTNFMTKKRKSLAHAQAIITELMKSIISQIRNPLHIAEVEGDAVFFYGVEEPNVYTWEQTVSAISKKLPDFFSAFYSRLNLLKNSSMCHCSACDGISDLRLKIIAHIGEAVFYNIANFSKLSGPDVILVHRLLKNSIEEKEYLLMTERAFDQINKHQEFEVDRKAESYEDLGRIIVNVYYPNLTSSSTEKASDELFRVPFHKKLKETINIGIKGMLISLGLKRLPAFRNLKK